MDRKLNPAVDDSGDDGIAGGERQQASRQNVARAQADRGGGEGT